MSNTENKDIFMSSNIFENLESSIVNLFKDQLHRKFQNDKIYSLSKRIYSSINPTQYFHLVFVTRRREGLVAMKDTMVKYESLKLAIESKFIARNDSKKAIIDDLFSTGFQLTSYTYKDFVCDYMARFNNGAHCFSNIVDYFLQASPLPFRDADKCGKSIYDYFMRLRDSNMWINANGRAFANLGTHIDIIIRSNLPDNYLINLSENPPIQQTLF